MWKTCSSRIATALLLASGSAAAAVPSSASECAKTLLLHAPSVIRDGVCTSVVPEPRSDLGPLGDAMFRVESCAAEPSGIAWFYAKEGACRLISGNIPYITNASFPLELSEQFAVNEFNRLIVERPSDSVSPKDVFGYTLAVLRMARPYIQQRTIASVSDIPATQPTRKRDQHRLASLRPVLSPPRVTKSAALSSVSFYVWSDPGGVIERVESLVWSDGRISYRATRVMDGVGSYSAKIFIPRIP